ncbi:11797_t:CDS:2, partial [Dentiscutata erythropus]
KRLLQIKHAIKLMEATMSADNNYIIRKDAIRLKFLMITEEEWKLDLTNMLTIFDEEEENIVDIDEELEIIITANGGKFKLSQPQNTDNLVEKVKENLYKALDHYWDTPLDCSLIAMLLDPRCKSMKKLNSWERDKAIDLLREKYDLLSIRNESITNL